MRKIAIEGCYATLIFATAIAGLPGFVVESKAVAQTGTPPTENLPAYNPKPLGTGYAVLIDYFNQPELAERVQQALGKNVGLVSYGQRPYLLALHTSNQKDATDTLKALSDRGFWVMVVDSQKVTLLRSQV
ncbi:hypothetical protein [Argonema antarcticum]|uniref:hypothetical protein n=1 Tax=Argonema antarcticum TaxID=2942763 RepID=UPI002013863E|nr:hypothetical protein [Argonema antarcticum]MCL1474850.1 hypothetical protein [Argonema antarcticum A004/B2]